jgi:hypothetical protein
MCMFHVLCCQCTVLALTMEAPCPSDPLLPLDASGCPACECVNLSRMPYNPYHGPGAPCESIAVHHKHCILWHSPCCASAAQFVRVSQVLQAGPQPLPGPPTPCESTAVHRKQYTLLCQCCPACEGVNGGVAAPQPRRLLAKALLAACPPSLTRGPLWFAKHHSAPQAVLVPYEPHWLRHSPKTMQQEQ